MGPLFSPASANAIQSSGRTGWPAVIVAPVTSPALVPSLGVGRKVPTGQRWKLNFATAAAEVEAAKENTTG
jgi:hypothetical protein